MKIALSSWSLNRKFFQGEINMIDFIKMAREDFGVDAIEPVHWMIPEMPDQQDQVARAFRMFQSENPDQRKKGGEILNKAMYNISSSMPKNLKEIKAALDKYQIEVLNIPIDYGNISQIDNKNRLADLEIIKIWIDTAAELGATGARVNTGNQPEGVFDLTITAASYRELAEYASLKDVALVLENHGGMSADPDNIVRLFEMVDHPNFRICPDFGNFADDIRYEALDRIFGLKALLVHAKTYDFYKDGSHSGFDFTKCMDIASRHGFDGYYSIEFEGRGDQVDGIKKTLDMLKEYLDR